MRIILFVSLLFFPFLLKTEANVVNDMDYTFFVIPTADPETAQFEIILKNEGEIPLHFEFPTSQFIDMTIVDHEGREVYDYSKGRYFLQAFQTISVKPHSVHKRVEKWNYQFKGQRVPPGEYTVNVTLKPVSLNGQPIKNRAKLSSTEKLFVPEENTAFRHVLVSGTKGDYLVTGEVKTSTGLFFYTVENGHIEYLKEMEKQSNDLNREWETFSFEIHIPSGILPDHGSLILTLYEKGMEGQIIHPYPKVLERFN